MATEKKPGAKPLQFGHGGEPWRTLPGLPGCEGRGTGFNSATAVNRGEPARRGSTSCQSVRFNSATAVNRGEPSRAPPPPPETAKLQFGHGGEPWRTLDRDSEVERGGACFNSATAVNRGEPNRPDEPGTMIPLRFNSATAVNRGEPPGRTRRRYRPARFNSATAVNRGEPLPGGRPGIVPGGFNSATAVNRGEPHPPAGDADRVAVASIRPRR